MKNLNILLAGLLAVSHCSYYADIAEGRYHDMGDGIKTEVYKVRQLFIPNAVDEIMVKIKNRTDKPIMLLEDSFSGFPILSKEELKQKILSHIEYTSSVDRQNAQGRDAILTLCLKLGPFLLAIGAFGAYVEDMERKHQRINDDDAAIIAISVLASLIGPLIFFGPVKSAQNNVEKQAKDLRALVNKEFENENLLFVPPVVIKPGEQKEVHIFVEKNVDWANELWIDIYDASGKKVVSRFSKIIG